MGRITNKHPRRATIIADPGIAERIPRAKALRVNVVAPPDGTDPNAFLGTASPMLIIEEASAANALDNEPINIYEHLIPTAENLIPNAEPVRVFVVSGSLGAFPASATTATPTALVVSFSGNTAGTTTIADWTVTEDGADRAVSNTINNTVTIVLVVASLSAGTEVVVSYDGTGDYTSGGVSIGAFTDYPVPNTL